MERLKWDLPEGTTEWTHAVNDQLTQIKVKINEIVDYLNEQNRLMQRPPNRTFNENQN